MQRNESEAVAKVKYITMTFVKQTQSRLYHYGTKH
jgi:hypothetical protein